MEDVEKAGWVSEHQDTELDIEFLNIKHILNGEEKEQCAECHEKVSFRKSF